MYKLRKSNRKIKEKYNKNKNNLESRGKSMLYCQVCVGSLAATSTCSRAGDGLRIHHYRNHVGKPVASKRHPINQKLGRVPITALRCRFSNLGQDEESYRVLIFLGKVSCFCRTKLGTKPLRKTILPPILPCI